MCNKFPASANFPVVHLLKHFTSWSNFSSLINNEWIYKLTNEFIYSLRQQIWRSFTFSTWYTVFQVLIVFFFLSFFFLFLGNFLHQQICRSFTLPFQVIIKVFPFQLQNLRIILDMFLINWFPVYANVPVVHLLNIRQNVSSFNCFLLTVLHMTLLANNMIMV